MQDEAHSQGQVGAGRTGVALGVHPMPLSGPRAGHEAGSDAGNGSRTGAGVGKRRDLRTLLDEYERRLILLALDASGGHQRRAAASLGVLPSTLSEKMKRLGLRLTLRAAYEQEQVRERRATG